MPNNASPIDAPTLLAIVGPTATGKTAVGVHLAERLGGEIISADSMAVYRGMDIGTAKPNAGERAAAPFHLLDVAQPDEPFSVAQFKHHAEQALTAIAARGHRALLVGGTGLYVRALLEGFGLTETPADMSLRTALNEQAERDGSPALHARLAEVDPRAASRIHPNDRVRIVRALEVFERTGVPMSVQQERDARTRTKRHALKFALTADRDELYRRIDERVDAMVRDGLEDEVRGLLAAGYSTELSPMRSLGYKEMVAFIEGDCDKEAAIQAIKQNTRRFAKRQLTWFRSDPDLEWIDVRGMSPQAIAERVLGRLAG